MRTQKLTFYIFNILIFVVQFAQAQNTKNLDLSTPYNTISTHIDNLQKDNYHPEISAQTLYRGGQYASLKKRKDLAIKLLKIMDARGLEVDYEKLPRNPKFEDTTASEANKKIYRLFPNELPDIAVQKVGSQWLYTKKTLDQIPSLYQNIGIVEKVIGQFPAWFESKILGMTIFHYLALVALLFISLLLHKFFSYFFRNLFTRLITKLGKGQRGQRVTELVQSIARPASLFFIFRLWIWLLPSFVFPLTFIAYTILFLKVSLPIYAMMIGVKVVDFVALYMGKLAEKTEGTMDDQLIPLLKRALTTFVYIIGFIFILEALNFNVQNIITGLSIGGLAFAFAAQDTIKNLFGSLTIFMDRPFQVGDWIVAGNINGTVEEVGFRSTRIRT
ncbi:MAG TPA: mechanosensitive ion channel protein, partial [Microscillaceae bacterium]|nr:mechanosensitive ion channel protein [Microscillaceae bacterium]